MVIALDMEKLAAFEWFGVQFGDDGTESRVVGDGVVLCSSRQFPALQLVTVDHRGRGRVCVGSSSKGSPTPARPGALIVVSQFNRG